MACKIQLFSYLAAQLEWALNLIPAKFEALYGRRKPQLADPIIFTCRSGRRAQAAAERTILMGYTKWVWHIWNLNFRKLKNLHFSVRFYEGSWLEWCVKEDLPCGNWSNFLCWNFINFCPSLKFNQFCNF
jgi:rhodanese-related sulfurtransferase